MTETSAKPLRIACVGEVMIELSFTGADLGQPHLGTAGDTFNTAVYLQRAIGTRGAVSYVTALGTDPFSDRIMEFIAAQGLGTESIHRDPTRLPGLYAITTDTAGERSFHYWREQAAARRLFQTESGISFAALDGFDVIYLSGITLAILPAEVRAALGDWLADARARGVRLAFDSNYRPRLWSSVEEARAEIGRLWALCEIGLPSVDDEMALFGDPSEREVLLRLRQLGLRQGALKRGAAGPIALDPEVEGGLFPAAPNVVDTTAAGDSFNGAFLAAHLTGADCVSAMEAGHNMAAAVVGFRGALQAS